MIKTNMGLLTVSLTSSVSTPSISTTVLVATTGSITVVIPLEATTTAATESTLPVVKAFLRGWASLTTLVIVLLQQIFSLITLQLNERHRLQEVARLRESKVGFKSDRRGHRRRKTAHPARDGWKEREGWGVVVKTRAVTPPEDKIKNYYDHIETLENKRN